MSLTFFKLPLATFASFTALAIPVAPPANAPVALSPENNGIKNGRNPLILGGTASTRGMCTLALPQPSSQYLEHFSTQIE